MIELDLSKGKPNLDRHNEENTFVEKVKCFLEDWYSASDYVRVQTSGSTGVPKIFEVEKEKMLNSAKMTCDFLNLKKGDTALLCLPIEYISGKMMLVRALERELKLIVEPPSLKPLESITEPVDFCAMTPLQVENSLNKLCLIKKLIIGGAAVSPKLMYRIVNVINCNGEEPLYPKIYETYGMSETLSHIALKSIFPIQEEYFKVLDGIEIDKDERGCLTVFAPKLSPQKIITNDLVNIKNKYEFKFLGRIDNVINSGGVKIFPEELERLVKKHISNEVVFIGLPDESLGQKLVLVIEGKENEEVRTQLLEVNYSSSFLRPKEIFFVEKIPRTPNGKVSRLGLVGLFLDNRF